MLKEVEETGWRNFKPIYIKKPKRNGLNKTNTRTFRGTKKKRFYHSTAAESIVIARNLIAWSYHEYFVKKMIDNIHTGLDDPIDNIGSTLLIMATKQGMHQVVEYLIQKGANPNKSD